MVVYKSCNKKIIHIDFIVNIAMQQHTYLNSNKRECRQHLKVMQLHLLQSCLRINMVRQMLRATGCKQYDFSLGGTYQLQFSVQPQLYL